MPVVLSKQQAVHISSRGNSANRRR